MDFENLYRLKNRYDKKVPQNALLYNKEEGFCGLALL